MVGIGRDLSRSSSPNPLPKQGHLDQVAKDLVQAGLEYLQRRRLHNLPRQPVPVLSHPQSVEVLPHFWLELPVLQFVPIAPCPVAEPYWKELDPVLLTPTLNWVKAQNWTKYSRWGLTRLPLLHPGPEIPEGRP